MFDRFKRFGVFRGELLITIAAKDDNNVILGVLPIVFGF